MSDTDRATWRERERLVEDLEDDLDPSSPRRIRSEIETSWRRCHAIGVSTGGGDLPYDPGLDRHSRLRRAADPVIDRLAEQLAHAPATILLADRNARIVDRWAGSHSLINRLDNAQVAPGFGYAEEHSGTNGIGTALEERKLFEVRGGEHFRESLQNLACVGKPIIHPIGRTLEGILDITSAISDVNGMMAPLVIAAVRDIEARLYEEASRGEQALLQEFLRISRRGKTAVVTMSHDMILANPAASGMLDPSDQTLLWNWATRGLERADEHIGEVRLASQNTVQARARRITEDRSLLGVTIELRPLERPAPIPRQHLLRANDPAPTEPRFQIVGRSLATQRLKTQLDLLVATPGPVLITGEPGVGKAHASQHLAERWSLDGQVFTVDAASKEAEQLVWVDDLREHLDHGGAVIVRRVDELPAAVVPRFQAFVEESARNSAPLIATARGIESPETSHVHAHFIRRLWLVPLRQRLDEVEDLGRALLTKHTDGQVPRLQPAALQCLRGYDWPGNVRELESALASAVLRSMHGDITVAHLPEECRSPDSRKRMSSLARAEREALIQALEHSGGNKAVAAEQLGIARSTLYRKMRTLGLEDDRFHA